MPHDTYGDATSAKRHHADCLRSSLFYVADFLCSQGIALRGLIICDFLSTQKTHSAIFRALCMLCNASLMVIFYDIAANCSRITPIVSKHVVQDHFIKRAVPKRFHSQQVALSPSKPLPMKKCEQKRGGKGLSFDKVRKSR